MANVYSQRFYTATSLASGTTNAATVPAGYDWVVHDVEFQWSTGTWQQGLFGAMLLVPGGAPFATTPHPAVSSIPYQWTGRVVLTAGETLQVFTHEAGWSVIVCGYALTLP